MKLLLTFNFLSICVNTFAQTLFYEDEFKGGATASGGSPGAYATFTPSEFEIYIPSGSTIRKAYLFAGRHGDALDTEVDLNGYVYEFNESNQVSVDFYSIYTSGGPAGVHAIDVSADIDPTVTDYTLTVLDEYTGPSNIYLDFYLFVTYDNPALDSTFVSIYLNEEDFDDSETDPVWEINLPKPMDTTCVDIGIIYMTGYACFLSDGERAFINGTDIGVWGGNEDNSGDCGGPLGSFAYYEGDLIGLMDDDEDAIVDETDVIATINEYIEPGATYLELNFEYVTAGVGESSNAIWLAAIVYGEGAEIVDSLVLAGDDALICIGDTVQIFATGIGDFEWSPAASLSDPYINNPFAFPSSTTTYLVSVDNGCFADVDSLTVIVDEFSINLDNEIEICIDDDAEIGIENEDGVIYSWSPSYYLSATDISNPVTSATENITYTLIAENENACVSEDAVDIIINSAQVTASGDTTLLLGGSAMITTEGDGVTYSWQPTDFIDCTQCPEITATPKTTTTYIVMITDEDGCIDYDTVTVFVDAECSNLIHFPNVFSPNADHINDVFFPITYLQDVQNINFKIYNRWGEIVFEANTQDAGWNGTQNGKPADVGSYVYVFQFDCFGKNQVKSGSFLLIR